MLALARRSVLTIPLLAGLASLAPARAGAEACCPYVGGCTDLGPAEACSGWDAGPGTDCVTFDCDATQACCAGAGSCQDLTPGECISIPQRLPRGVGTTCAGTGCITEACCTGGGGCYDSDPGWCRIHAFDGVPQGPGTTCASGGCDPQACCATWGCDEMPPMTCAFLGGTAQGPGTTCTTHCLQACCHVDGSCSDELPGDCLAQGGARYPYSTCAFGADCARPRRCCLPDGTCSDVIAVDCASLGGSFEPYGSCDDGACPGARPGWVPDGASRPGAQMTIRKGPVAPALDLAWGDSCSVSYGSYVVLRGLIGDWLSHSPTDCPGTTTTSVRSWQRWGISTYYLVAPTTSSLLGSLGVDSFGNERPPPAVGYSCPTRQDLGCP